MKENNDIDKLFKEGLHQDFPVDQNLWQEVESQLPSKESKNGFWIYLNSFAVLAILGMSLMLSSDNVANQKFLSSKSILHSLVEEEKSIPLAALAKNESTVNPDRAQQDAETTMTNKTLDRSATSSSKRNKKANQILAAESKKSVTKKAVEKTNNQAAFKAGIQNKSLEQGLLSTEASSTSSFIYQKEVQSIEIGKLDLLQPLGYSLKANTIEGFALQAKENKLNKFQQRFKPHFFEYELSYYQSLAVEKQLNELSSSLKNYRDQGEKSLQVEQYGFSIFRPFKFLQFGVGIQYSQYQERAAYDISTFENGVSVSYDTSYRIVNANYSSNGVPVLLISEEINRTETPTTVANEKQLIVSNRISRLQLPISVGYRRNFGRFQAGLRTAFVLNYLNQSSGAYISNERNQLLPFSETEQFNSILFSHQNQLNLGYAINEYFVFGGRLGHTYDLNSFTKAYDSRLQHYGIGFWLRFQPK
ncbi:MAG: hypothetical protein RIC95_04190 [Vicingaceae bacterium]